MIALDSSLAIAGFATWHELNSAACALLDAGAAIPAHALLETYSVLTAFPPPHRVNPNVVLAWLDDRFADATLEPPPAAEQLRLIATLTAAGRTGGAVYDGLVGLTAKLAGAELATADRRARPIYELVGVRVQWVGHPPSS